MTQLDVTNDEHWRQWGDQWEIDPQTTYLNHGSFGPSPRPVREAYRNWQDELQKQPMRFFLESLEPALRSARAAMAEFVGTSDEDLIFVENATVGMNIVADSFPLDKNDEILLTNHEYGAVFRIWQRACGDRGAHVKSVELPTEFSDPQHVVDSIVAAITPNTKMLVLSHITSATAIVLPVQQICAALRERGVAVCIDGPHAPVQVPVDIADIGCDFYTASNHKWLSAPFGSGFLFVAKPYQSFIRPSVLSWGRLKPHPIESWSDEFIWRGTRDPASFLATQDAIQFINQVTVEAFRARSHHLAQYARRTLTEITQLQPLVPDDPTWYASMAMIGLPNLEMKDLWEHFRERNFEILFEHLNDRTWLRVSCHLYNDHEQIDRLGDELKKFLRKD